MALPVPPNATARDILAAACERLQAAGCAEAALDARVLFEHATGWSRAEQIADPGRPVPEADMALFSQLIEARAAREPVAYLTGRKEFWSLEFETPRGVLIPRPDSETLVTAALEFCPGARRVLDLGTGTGCLLIALLSELPDARGVGLDRSPVAAACAERNAARLGVADRAEILCTDWEAFSAGGFDLILSNPPYIESGADLPRDVAAFEPPEALFAGPDGLDAYQQIVKLAPRSLTESGVLIVEVGAGQADQVEDLMRTGLGGRVERRRDLAGIERCLVSTPLQNR